MGARHRALVRTFEIVHPDRTGFEVEVRRTDRGIVVKMRLEDQTKTRLFRVTDLWAYSMWNTVLKGRDYCKGRDGMPENAFATIGAPSLSIASALLDAFERGSDLAD